MKELIKRLVLSFFLLGVITLALGWVWHAQGQERKAPEVQIPKKPLPEDA